LAAELVSHSKATEVVILRELARLELHETAAEAAEQIKN
jgi:hypothetical protein